MPQSPSKQAPGALTQFSQLPSATLSYFPESHQRSEISSLKGDLSFSEKPEDAGCQIWAVAGLSHLGDLMFGQKTLNGTCCMSGRIVVMKLPITSCP